MKDNFQNRSSEHSNSEDELNSMQQRNSKKNTPATLISTAAISSQLSPPPLSLSTMSLESSRRNRSIINKINRQLRPLGLQAKDVPAGGNCMMNALSDQLIGSYDNHLLYRKEVCNYMLRNKDMFQPYIVHRNYDEYIRALMEPNTMLGQEALAAFCQLKSITITVHQLNCAPIRFGSIVVPCESCLNSPPSRKNDLCTCDNKIKSANVVKDVNLFFYKGHYLSVVKSVDQ
ncbi:hypothetical protein GJ496_000749 [Pomphorhynchus laevis]|nr:hypothetical protein GJ496_000749 [Pomphorhynchus laevis]